jgi:hypothetical protein
LKTMTWISVKRKRSKNQKNLWLKISFSNKYFYLHFDKKRRWDFLSLKVVKIERVSE